MPMLEKDLARLSERFGESDRLNIRIISLSDRAARGVYDDRGGPAIQTHLESCLRTANVAAEFTRRIIPDDRDTLRDLLRDAHATGVHACFTTGSTGLGPRDIAPDVIAEEADKTIPGIMEMIRVKYGAEKPLALLSRSIAATKGQMLIYALPGSPKAIDEYMPELMKTFPHLVCVLHGIEAH